MEKLVINGQRPLRGEVVVSGAKNDAVAVIPAALLIDGPCRIENVPRISDVKVIIEILAQMGAYIEYEDENTIIIDTSDVKSHVVNSTELVKSMRASYYLLGALLGRFNRAEVSFPGGCDFGFRPVDQHIKGFEALGAGIEIVHGVIKAEAEKLVGSQIYLDVVSVGATINIMMAAVRAQGVTVIENPAKEPHIVDVANFLNAAGANIKGAGTDVIKIKGVDRLKGGITHAIIPDQIEAGTFMTAAAATMGDVVVRNVIPKHMESLSAKLIEMNIKVQEGEDWIRVTGNRKINRANIKTLPYPGFVTDWHPPVTVLLCLAEGTSIITDSIWERFQYVDELKRMGARIKVEGRMAVIEGVTRLSGAQIRACDLRAGAAMVVAGLIAEGRTEINDIKYIDRGYENFEGKFRNLGADIERITE